jgi:parvulin-like peptidyl-prolyl isomerase
MENFDAMPFLAVDGQSISLGQVLRYLQLFGKLRPFVQEVVSQHVICQEIQKRNDLEVSTADFEQAVIDFRMKQKLTDAESFEQWLAAEGMNYAAFQNRVVLGFKLEKLKTKIAEPRLQNYFSQQQQALKQVELSCLITSDKSLAEQLQQKVLAGEASFDELVKSYASVEAHPAVSVIRGPARQQQLPEGLREAIDAATPGELVGPIAMADRWCLFQVEQVIPAVLEGPLQRELEEQLFKQWLAEQVQQLSIQLATGQ